MANIEVTISPADNLPIPEEEETGDDTFKGVCDIQNLFELDDFEQFSARASSGGSLYGVLRKQALLQALGTDGGMNHNPHIQQEFLKRSNFLCPPGPMYHHRHNRSKSLVHRKQTLADDKSILKYLYDYTENKKLGGNQPPRHGKYQIPDIRRHSEATMNCHLFIQSGNLPSEIIDEVASGLQSSNPLSGRDRDPTSFITQVSSSSVPQSKFSGKFGRQTRLQSLHGPPQQPPPTIPNVGVCRRRSFSIRQNEIKNEGDEMLFVPMGSSKEDEISPGVSTRGVGHESRRSTGKSWRDSSLSRSTSTKPLSYNTPPSGSIVQAGPSSTPLPGESNFATESGATERPGEADNLYRVLMLGGPGVGKTALTQQFLTSEYMAAQNTSFDDCVQVTVPVLLDGDSIFVEFIDLPYNGDSYQWKDFGDVDGYVIVYSIIDRRSFNKAVEILDQIKGHAFSSRKPVILVANKNDLERSRLIGKQEGRTTSESRDCKYIDVSAILNHKVDDLLVGVLKQMRDSRNLGFIIRSDQPEGDSESRRTHGKHAGDIVADKMTTGCFAGSKNAEAQKTENLWTKLIRKKSWKRILSKSCENLL